MIIWDTGEYEILPYQMESTMPETETDDSRSEPAQEYRSENEKLIEAFRMVRRKATEDPYQGQCDLD